MPETIRSNPPPGMLEMLEMSRTDYSKLPIGKKLIALRDIKAQLLDQQSDLWDAIGDGEPSAEQHQQFNMISNQEGTVDHLIGEQIELLNEEKSMPTVRNQNRSQVEAEQREEYGGTSQRTNNGAGVVMFRDVNTGQDIRAYRHGESLATALTQKQEGWQPGDSYRESEPAADQGDYDIGRVIAAKLLNRQDILTPYEIKASAYGGSETDGGYLLNPAGSLQVLDLARSASRVMQAGAMTVPMTSRELNVVRVTGDPTATWRAETVDVPASNPTFDRVTLRARTLSAIVPVSIEMLEDSANAADQIRSLLQTALAAELDRAALVGAAAGEEPTGIVNTSGVDEQSSVGTPSDYTDVSASVLAILTANYPGEVSDLAWLAHPAQFGTYDGLVSSADAQPLMPTPWAGSLRKLSTTKLSGTMVVGHFPQLLIGMRTSGVRIEVLPAGSATDSSGNVFNVASQLMRLVVAHLRADVVCLRPTWFSKLTGVTSS